MNCSKCGKPRDRPGQRYCRECHNEYVRAWRAAGRERLTPEHHRRDAARSAARYLMLKGDLRREPCEVCGSEDEVEMHHDDYDRVADVRWFCRVHHNELPKDDLLCRVQQ